MDIEVWKSLDFMGFPDYEVSNFGNVKSLNYNNTRKERILKPCKQNNDYLFVGLHKNNKQKNFRVHKLVALAFIPNDKPIEKTEINHLDENKENNHVSNLCWCSHIENINYGTRNDRISQANKGKYHTEEAKKKMSIARKEKPNYKRRKPIQQYTKDMTFIKEWDSAKFASLELGIDNSGITACCQGKQKTCGGFIWKYKENDTDLVVS